MAPRARSLSPYTLAAVTTGLLLLAFLWAIASGAVSLGFGDIRQALFTPAISSNLAPDAVPPQANPESSAQKLAQVIVWQLRLPRVLLAACIGALLALGGAIMQGLFRNPLADPSLIGVTAGSIAGASAVIVLGGTIGNSAVGAVTSAGSVAADAGGVAINAGSIAAAGGVAINTDSSGLLASLGFMPWVSLG
ncbi:MAG: iron chelate uptake ABC transporter family permease subunit, partial [Pseudomonadales bacterium]|nr:iron chelate uptake ABC transporter family permease subunit [Pseudomonadales bacterium]